MFTIANIVILSYLQIFLLLLSKQLNKSPEVRSSSQLLNMYFIILFVVYSLFIRCLFVAEKTINYIYFMEDPISQIEYITLIVCYTVGACWLISGWLRDNK